MLRYILVLSYNLSHFVSIFMKIDEKLAQIYRPFQERRAITRARTHTRTCLHAQKCLDVINRTRLYYTRLKQRFFSSTFFLDPRPSAKFSGKMRKFLRSLAEYLASLAFLYCRYIFDLYITCLTLSFSNVYVYFHLH